jgi:UDP-N-acetylglucosamine--dolichyl-phosphate N-acetylglucosaminephosphotransferase
MWSIRLINAGIMLVAFFVTYFLAKPFIKKARAEGFVVKDMYKRGKPLIPTMGGLVILAGIVISLVFAELFTRLMVPLLVFYFIVFVYAMYGLMDDLFSFRGRRHKVWVLFLLAMPIAVLTTDTSISLVFFSLELGALYAFVFAPLYIMVVSNLVNMHAGFNGLSGGLTFIMLFFAAIKAYIENNSHTLYLILPVIGALGAFMLYNKYPSRLLLGNVGQFLIGGALGAYLVLANIEWFGVVLLIPHIVNFVLWLYWCRMMHKVPHVKFAPVRRDGTIDAPNGLTMKYLVAKWFRVNEWQAVLVCYGITFVFGVVGLMWF